MQRTVRQFHVTRLHSLLSIFSLQSARHTMPTAPVSAEEQKRRKREWARAHRQKARTTNQAQYRQECLTNQLVQLVDSTNQAVGGSPQAVAATEAPFSNQEREEQSRRQSPRLHDGHLLPAVNPATRAVLYSDLGVRFRKKQR
jgi:hypothetical protein